jgi:hypothetical protein
MKPQHQTELVELAGYSVPVVVGLALLVVPPGPVAAAVVVAVARRRPLRMELTAVSATFLFVKSEARKWLLGRKLLMEWCETPSQ